jgi:hypothetical protein
MSRTLSVSAGAFFTPPYPVFSEDILSFGFALTSKADFLKPLSQELSRISYTSS